MSGALTTRQALNGDRILKFYGRRDNLLSVRSARLLVNMAGKGRGSYRAPDVRQGADLLEPGLGTGAGAGLSGPYRPTGLKRRG